jgi:hypothetical protein
MVQHVLAQEPSAAVLESACRNLIDEGKPFAPQTGEVVRAVKAEIDAWRPRKGAIRNIESVYQEIIEEIPKAKAAAEKRKAEAEANAARKRAESEAAAARWRAEQEAEAACKQAEAEEARWKAEEEGEGLRYSLGQYHARKHVTLQAALKEFKNQFTRHTYVISCAIGVFDERRKLRAWERESEAEQHEALMSECIYNAGGNGALNRSSTLEGLLKDGVAQYSRTESWLVSYALGVFEMRRDLCAWRQGWTRGRFGLPIWA